MLVKTQDEVISSELKFLLFPQTHPPDSENLPPPHASLFSLLFYQKEETFSYKNLAFPCALIDATAWFLFQQLVSFPPRLPLPLTYNTHALTSSGLSYMSSRLQASRKSCLYSDFIFLSTFSPIH